MNRLVLLTAVLTVFSSFAQCQSASPDKSPEFDHIALYVRDLQKSADFYDKVVELQRMPEPFHDGRHVWYRIGAHDQLHVISGATSVPERDVNAHLAFRVASLPEFVVHLNRLGISYRQSVHGDGKTATVRPDGVHQVYFQDPDGYWIEVNDDKF